MGGGISYIYKQRVIVDGIMAKDQAKAKLMLFGMLIYIQLKMFGARRWQT